MDKLITASTPKSVNYTDEAVEALKVAYLANPTRETVDTLAAKLNKKPRSIIAKLSNLKIYKAPIRTTKTGTPIVKKEALVAEISETLNIDISSLVKANKQDLERLVNRLNEVLK